MEPAQYSPVAGVPLAPDEPGGASRVV